MPAEPTKAKLKRHSSRKDLQAEEYHFDTGQARELEHKRSRGEVSCAECRRLKIKCDKKIPCQSCQRRGCANLCPNGSLSTGQGTRFVLAATEHLHHRITKLSGRIRQLEDALAVVQSRNSGDPHPLLHEDLVSIDENDDEPTMDDSSGGSGPSSDVIDAFGRLSIADHGISRFFGPTGGSESLLISTISSSTDSSPITPNSDLMGTDHSGSRSGLSLFSPTFPFAAVGGTADMQNRIRSHLPTWEQALEFAEVYLQQVSWMFRGVTRGQLIDDMLPVIYRHQSSQTGDDYSGPHNLALVFIIFGMASLVQAEPSNALAEHFHQLSKAAMALQPLLERPSIVTVQVLLLLSTYNTMSGVDLKSETNTETTWSLVTLAAHLSQTIGLHRDSARWGLTPEMVQRRRTIFWDIFIADAYQSLNTGRPPSFSIAYIDCDFPEPEGLVSKLRSSWSTWHYRFTVEIVAEVTARTLTAETPNYAIITELDQKVREFPIPEGHPHSSSDFEASIQQCMLDNIRENILMFIHRSFFARAIIEHPENPLKSQYAPSFLATYRASSTILKSISQQFNMWPSSTSRFWVMWTSAFTAGMVFGTVITHGPRLPLARAAMSELEKACVLFSKASVYSIRVTKALSILTKLREKARYALDTMQSNTTIGDDRNASRNIKEEHIVDDVLSIIAGHTRFVVLKKPTPQQQWGATAPSSQSHRPNTSTVSHGASPQVPAQVVPAPAASDWVSQVEGRRRKEDFISLLPLDEDSQSMGYPYVPSERTQQIERSTSYGWSHDHSAPSDLSLPPLRHHEHASHYAVPRQFGHVHPGSHLQMPHLPPLEPPQSQRHLHHMSPNQHDNIRRNRTRGHQEYPATPASNIQLVDVGLAPRDSWLDERWGSFMEDSGLPEDIEFS